MTRKLLVRSLLYAGIGSVCVALLTAVVVLITGWDPRSIPPHRYVLASAGLLIFSLTQAAMSLQRRAAATGQPSPRFSARIIAPVVGGIIVVATVLVLLL